jgi:hypothetical protein
MNPMSATTVRVGSTVTECHLLLVVFASMIIHLHVFYPQRGQFLRHALRSKVLSKE